MSEITVGILQDGPELLEARRLHGRRYVEAGFVDALTVDGVIDDSWVSISTYFGAVDPHGNVVGVARLIPNTALGLPALQEFELSPIGVEAINAVVPDQLVEVSALAVKKGQGLARTSVVADGLYRAMYQHSVVTAGYSHWCAALDVRVKTHLINSHNFLLLEEIGAVTDYLGSPTVPVMLDLFGQARHSALTSPESSGFYLSGLVVDLRGEDVRLEAGSAEYLPTETHTFATE